MRDRELTRKQYYNLICKDIMSWDEDRMKNMYVAEVIDSDTDKPIGNFLLFHLYLSKDVYVPVWVQYVQGVMSFSSITVPRLGWEWFRNPDTKGWSNIEYTDEVKIQNVFTSILPKLKKLLKITPED